MPSVSSVRLIGLLQQCHAHEGLSNVKSADVAGQPDVGQGAEAVRPGDRLAGEAAAVPSCPMAAGGSTFLLRFARILRLLRLARLGRFSYALDTVIAAIRSRGHELGLSMAVAFVLLLANSTMVYLCEAEHQPEAFGSIPRAMW